MADLVPNNATPTARPGIGVMFLNALPRMYAPQQTHAKIAQRLDRDCFRVFVVVPTDCEDPAAWKGNSDLTVWRVPLGKSIVAANSVAGKISAAVGLAQLALGIGRLAVRMRSERIQIIHIDGGPRSVLAAVALGWVSRAALVVHVHEIRQSPENALFNLAMRRAKAVLLVSEAGRASYVGAGAVAWEKTRIVYNGTDVERFRPGLDGTSVRDELGIRREAKLVLLAGRFVPWKGQAELLQAVSILIQRGHDVMALLVGRPDPTAPGFEVKIGQLRQELDLADRVVVASHREDMPAVMAAADVVAVPSYEEPFGLTVIEAMACERPVVGSNTGGIPEIVEDEVTGLLIPPREPEALAGAIERYLVDPDLRARVTANARRRVVADFTLDKTVEKVASTYQEIVERRTRPGRLIRNEA